MSNPPAVGANIEQNPTSTQKKSEIARKVFTNKKSFKEFLNLSETVLK